MSVTHETSKDLTWEQSESRDGNDYQVGRNEEEVTAKTQAEEEAAKSGENKQLFGLFEGKKKFDIKVDWGCYLPKYSRLQQTTQDFADRTGISAFNFTTGFPLPWTFYLEFTNTKNYSYVFYDSSGDSYSVNCFVTGNHTVRFNSKAGEDCTIVRITGE